MLYTVYYVNVHAGDSQSNDASQHVDPAQTVGTGQRQVLEQKTVLGCFSRKPTYSASSHLNPLFCQLCYCKHVCFR